MNTRRDPDRLIHAFLMEGATELADEVYLTVRDRIEQTRQRAVIGRWREPDVNRYLKIALAAAAVVVVALVGYRQFGGTNVAGPGSSASPAPTPSATPSVTSAPSTSGSGSAPPLTETFSSDLHGVTFSYPSGWVSRPATEPWTTGLPDFGSNAGDIVYDQVLEGNLWIVAASQPIGDASPDEWVTERLTVDALGLEGSCSVTEPITIDGATGLIGREGCNAAAVTTDGRGYVILLYVSDDDPSVADTYDRAWFEDVLATVQLPSGSGSAPPLTESFTSARHGLTMSTPSGWVTRPATEPWTTSVPDYVQNSGDVIHDPVREGNLWIVAASQPIGDASPDEWVTERLTVDALGLEGSCSVTEPITIDGATGLIGREGCNAAAVTTDGRGYFILLYTSGDEPSLALTYDRAWFEEVLATIQLLPEDATD